MAYFRTFSEVRNRSLTLEMVGLFYMEIYLPRKCVSRCDLGFDNANWVSGLDIRRFWASTENWQQIQQLDTNGIFGQWNRCREVKTEMFKDICINNKSCELMKSVNRPKYGSRTILTDSCWEYVALFLKRQSISGASDALFYWEQAHSFYLASQELPDNARGRGRIMV